MDPSDWHDFKVGQYNIDCVVKIVHLNNAISNHKTIYKQQGKNIGEMGPSTSKQILMSSNFKLKSHKQQI